jgi:hypothetical protein
VAGLVVGIAGYHLFFAGPLSEGSLDTRHLVGTITSIDNGLDIDVAGVKGTIALREREDLAESVIDIVAEKEVDVILEYPGPSVHFEAASRNNRALPQVSISGNTILLNKLGDGKYVTTFRREVQGSPLRVRITSEGEVLLDETVAPGGSH